MGCTGSKLDDLQAVALCRDRFNCLDDAIRHRYALADAHVAYIGALSSVGTSLQHFFNLEYIPSPPSPVLPLPTQKKGDPDENPAPAAIPNSSPPLHHLPHSNSGSHLHFHSDSDNDSGSGSPLSGHSAEFNDHHHHHHHETVASSPPRFFANYMQNRGPAPSVAFEQRPENSETAKFGESSYGYSYPDPNSYSSSNSYPNSYSYPYAYPPGYGNYGGINSFFGSPSQYNSYSSPPAAPAAAADPGPSTSKPPPPPPSPPRASTWDLLFNNPFDVERYYPTPYTPSRGSRDSREVREEEGIPDLEDEDFQHEVVKEVHGEQKYVDSKVVENENDRIYETRSTGGAEATGVDYEVHSVDKNVLEKEERAEDRANVGAFKVYGFSGVSEVVSEIKGQFDRASESGKEVAKMLEAGKLPYHRKHGVHKVSSKMLHVITPSLPMVSSQPSTSKSAESLPSTENDGSLFLDFDEDKGMKAGNLSSTLEKLYIWEKKLYEEVKAEEKMQIILERKCRRLKHLDERGAEAHKVEATRTFIRDLSTKMRIAIQVVDSISNKINKLRDEELWPQINELIQGLLKMWQVMLECHHAQYQAIKEAKGLDAVASSGKFSDAHMEATMELEFTLLNWTLNFFSWISAQKGYIKALNSWLLKCLHCEPEETDDGTAPFSPGRIGAPPVFVICNQWSQAMDNISESEVLAALQAFATSVLQLWERHNMEQRQRMMVNRDMDRRLKSLEEKEQKMQKTLDAVNKKLVLISEQSGLPLPGQIVHRSHAGDVGSLQLGLKMIFEAMKKFSADSMKVYQDLLARSEEDRLARENAKVP